MKKWLSKLKEKLDEISIILITIAILLVPCAIFIAIRWREFLILIENITAFGNGSVILGLLYFLFICFGGINAIMAFYLWLEKIFKIAGKKDINYYLVVAYLFIAFLGFYELIKNFI